MVDHILRNTRRVLLLLTGVIALIIFVSTPVRAAPTAAVQPQADPGLCAAVDAVPRAECEALVALYNETDGENWQNAADWLNVTGGVTPCAWFGVTCAAGRVTRLELPRNGLRGAVPADLVEMEALQVLNLAGNALDGAIGRSVCRLVDTVTDFDIDYNKVRAAGNRAAACLAQLDPDWFATQTVAPADPQIVAATEDALTLAWTPVAYQADGGYYEVGYAPAVAGPWTLAGQTTDKAAAGFTIHGLEPGRTYYLRVRTVTLPHAGQPDTLADATVMGAAATRSDETVLLILYFAADNDLSVYVDPLLERLRRGTLSNLNVVVMALVDRAGPDNTEVWRIAQGTAVQDETFLAQLGQTELDTALPSNLTAFLDYARGSTPAARTLVSLLGHGVGLAPELAWVPAATPEAPEPAPRPGIPPLPRGKFATPTDVTSGTFMGTPALGHALLAATDDGADPFDLLFFDQCFAGNLDILYEVRAAADVFIASPNYAWLSAPYQRYLPEFAPTRSPADMANAVINVYQRSLNDAHPNAIFWLSRSDIEAVAAAVDDLALALVDAVDAGAGAAVYRAAQAGQYVDTTQCGRGNLTLGPPDELLGAGSFARALRAELDATAHPAVEAATAALLAALDNVTGNARVGNPYLEPDATWDYTDTLTILAPLRRDAPADRAWRASLYRADLAGQQAVWTPEPAQSVIISETFAYVEEGRWDDFIAAWYTGELTPTVGEWCAYTPPSLVTPADVEILPLSVTEVTVTGARALSLAWAAPLDATATTYALFAKRPGDVSWTLRQLLDATTTQTMLTGLEPGFYRFIIAAQDDAEAYIAKSAAVDVEVPGATTVFLPLVRGD